MGQKISIDLVPEIFDKLVIYAKRLGLTEEEAARFLLGAALSEVRTVELKPPMDPMDLLVNMASGMGILKCTQCTAQLTPDEIKKNGFMCFKCKPDTQPLDDLYERETGHEEDKK